MAIYGKQLKLCWHWVSLLCMETDTITMDHLPYIDKILQYAIDIL